MDDAKFTRQLDDTLQRQLGYPSEQELIEILNKHEYQLQLEQSSPAVSRLGDAGAERLSQVVLIREHLARTQNGQLDRFGLRHLTVVELEHRLHETDQAIEQLEREHAVRPRPAPEADSLADFFRGFGQMLTGPDPIQYQIFVKKKLLSELQLQIKLKQAGPPRRPTFAEQEREKAAARAKKWEDFYAVKAESLGNVKPEFRPQMERYFKQREDQMREEER